MTNPTITISPAEIRKGDFLLCEDGTAAWVALGDATTVYRMTPEPGWERSPSVPSTRVAVESADGVRGYRWWPEDADVRLAIVDDLGARSLRLV